jgi:beta-phosphoglucomutase-like phosphatase (HAD superfamily)
MADLRALPAFKALIFDCDGTLVMSADLHFAAFNVALAQQGFAMDPAWYAARTGLARSDLLGALAEVYPGLDVARAVQGSIEATLGAAAVCTPNAPVVDLARAWFGRVPMAVASNAEGAVLRAMLRACDLGALFDPIVSLDDVDAAKPDPAMFLLAAAQMGVAPADCLVLEDSDQGMQAARAAGMLAVDVR